MIEAFEIGVSLALETGDAQAALKGLGQQLSTLDTELARVHSRMIEAQQLSAPGHALVSAMTDQAEFRHRSKFDQPEQERDKSTNAIDISNQLALTDAYALHGYPRVLKAPDVDDNLSPDNGWQALPPRENLSMATSDSTLSVGPKEWQSVSFESAGAADGLAADTAYRGLSEAPRSLLNTQLLPDEAEELSRHTAPPATSGFVALTSPELGAAQPFFDGAYMNSGLSNNRIGDQGAEADARTTPTVLPQAENSQTAFTLSSASPALDLPGIAIGLTRGRVLGADGALSSTATPYGGMLPMDRGDAASLDNKVPEIASDRSSPVPPTFCLPASVPADRRGGAAPAAASFANAGSPTGTTNQENADPAMILHTHVHIDGDVVARAVSERLVSWMNGPLSGTGRFDPRRSYTPVES